ncbi:MAG TPA: ATP-dependent Clp protease adaptor ClpS [Anaerolineales bacterium]|nr:ATP-dependent Clp protease adaptor ClpS [Anaerolineales bacterium]
MLPEIKTPPRIQTDKASALEPLWRVIIHNDNITPMDFVIHTLANIFHLARLHALQVMYTAHYNGQAYVQSLPQAEGQRRIGMAHTSARLNGYPLQFTLERED